ncbi:unnamed protein product [Pocillopora meandrina]|uniref:EGF-like domain-containing protein n=1 Tax=Pocillopora meandrina TaxID=46732 RepID=A0AAU9X9T9_9CNID|nr:unnamed protein product [Pocillopora meandrina]
MDAREMFGEHERSKRVARAAAKRSSYMLIVVMDARRCVHMNFYQDSCLGIRQDLRGRSVITPNVTAFRIAYHNFNTARLAKLRFGSTSVSVYCHMGNFGCGDGVWTTVMKIDGNKATFKYYSSYWSDKNQYNTAGGETGFDSEETKLHTYWDTSFNKICLGMKVGGQMRFVALNKQATSLHSLIADGHYRATSLGRSTWKALIGSEASLQTNCNKEGFNAGGCYGDGCALVRIGIVSNEQNDCDSCDSRIGFGGAGSPDDSITCGNAVTYASYAFVKNQFHYLDAPSIEMFMVTDVFDCTFECLRLPSCVSVNVASNKEAPGNIFCELLSSDKYQKSQKFTGNKTSHHLFKKKPNLNNDCMRNYQCVTQKKILQQGEAIKNFSSQCISTPCQNGGTCLANYQDETFTCHCKDDFIGKHCENGATSCKQLFEAYNFNSTRVATLRFGLTSVSVYCHMGGFGCGDGVWTTVMKIDGSKSTFHYDSVYWGNTDAYNPPGGATAFDTLETKIPTYWNTPFTKICLGMKTARHINFVIINKEANSLYSLIADGSYRSTSLGRDAWNLTVIKKASIQYAATPVEPESVLSLTTKTPAQPATLELGLVEEDAPKTPILVTNISHAFMKNELHHLSVPSSRTFLATDVFDCTSQCLLLPSCVSVNLARNTVADGKYWCELLSSDKYLNSQDFKGNLTFHHLFKKFLLHHLLDFVHRWPKIKLKKFTCDHFILFSLSVKLYLHAVSKWRNLCGKVSGRHL